MNPIVPGRRISYKEFHIHMERALMTRVGQIATIVVDTCIIAMPLLFVIIQAIFHFMDTGFNPVDETISMYVWCEYGVAQSLAFFLESLVMFALTARLFFILPRTRRVKWGLAIFAVIGIGMMIVSFCPTRAYGAPVTGLVIAHVGAALVTAGLLPVALLLIATGFKLNQYWRRIYMFSIITSTMVIIVDLVGLFFILTDMPGLGIAERILIFFSVLWVFVVGTKLLYQSAKNFILYKNGTYIT